MAKVPQVAEGPIILAGDINTVLSPILLYVIYSLVKVGDGKTQILVLTHVFLLPIILSLGWKCVFCLRISYLGWWRFNIFRGQFQITPL